MLESDLEVMRVRDFDRRGVGETGETLGDGVPMDIVREVDRDTVGVRDNVTEEDCVSVPLMLMEVAYDNVLEDDRLREPNDNV